MPKVNNSEFYRNETYFANDQYSDAVINYFLYSAWDKSYIRTMMRQREFAQSMARTIPFNEFVHDIKLNTKLKLPARAYTYRMDGFRLPIADKKKFVKLYGNFNKPVAMKSIMRDGKTFAFSIDCSIGNFGFLDLYFYPTMYNYTYIVVLPVFTPTTVAPQDQNEIYETFDTTNPVAAGKLSVNTILALKEAGVKMTLQWTRHSEIYRTSGRLATILNRGTLILSIPRKNKFTPFMKSEDDTNSWDIYITDSPATGGYLYCRGIGSIERITDENIEFKIPSEGFATHVLQNTTGYIYAIHRPTRKSCLIYEHESGLTPIFQMSNLINPVNQVNYLVSEYDKTRTRKLQTEILDVAPKYYPNVIDLSATSWAGKDLLIEAYEIPIKDSTCKFDNPIANYMTNVGDRYPSIVTDAMKCPPEIAEYVSTIPVNAEGYPYLESAFVGNIRGYWLNILNDVCQDNPMMYKHLQHYINERNKKFITRSGDPKFLKFTQEYVMDNSAVAVVKKDDTTYFDEEHGILRYTSAQEDTPALVYLNGALTPITLEYYSVGFMYDYIPKRVMDEAMEQFNGSQADMAMAKPITIDAFPNYSINPGARLTELLRHYAVNDPKAIFEKVHDRDTISISDLIFYNNATMEYIDKDRLTFGFFADEYVIKHEKEDEIFLLNKATSIEYLMTSLGEVYRTMNAQEIILRNADINIPLDDYLSWQGGGLESVSNKEFPIGTLTVGIKDPSLIGVDIVVAIVNRYDNREFDGKTIIEQDHKVIFRKYNAQLDPRRIEVYFDGRLLNSKEYSINFPSAVGGDMVVDLNPIRVQISPTSVVRVVVLPLPFETIEWNLRDSNTRDYNFITHAYRPDRNNFTGEATGITMYELAPDVVATASQVVDYPNSRIFINGMRFAYEDRDDIQLSNMFYLTDVERYRGSTLKNPVEVWSTSTMTVKYPARDADIYKMNRLILQNMQQRMIDR